MEKQPKKEKVVRLVSPMTIYEALAMFQKECLVLPRNGESSINGKKYKYVLLDDLIRLTQPVLDKFNLMFYQLTKDGKLHTIVVHTTTGEKIESDMSLGTPQSPQDAGSRITYFRRYMLTSMLGLSSEEDIDGVKDGKMPEGLSRPPAMTNVGPALPKDTTPIGHIAAKSPDTFDSLVQELKEVGEQKTLESPFFTKAWLALDSATTPQALNIIKGQIERSERLNVEEKARLLEKVESKDKQINGTIKRD